MEHWPISRNVLQSVLLRLSITSLSHRIPHGTPIVRLELEPLSLESSAHIHLHASPTATSLSSTLEQNEQEGGALWTPPFPFSSGE
jgi:hypothetical protein